MSREDPIKAEKDFSSILDEKIPKIEALADYKIAVEQYLVLEKQTRQASDLPSSQRVIASIVKTLADHNDWDYLNEIMVVLSKKHGQLKTAIQGMIKLVIESLLCLNEQDKRQLETKIKLIETVRSVTDKKIFVEVERAQVSRILSDIYLNRYNDLDKAVETLCDLQVETYSLMPFSDKIDFILLQISLTLKKGDHAQAKILSRKILLKLLKNFEKADEYKATFLRFLVDISTFEKDYLETVRNLLLLVEIPNVKENAVEYSTCLINAIYYITLAAYNAHQHDLVLCIKANSIFKKNVPQKIYNLLEIFTTNELIHWLDIERDYSAEYFKKSPIFADETNYQNLQSRIVEHNLRIVNAYYQCIKLDRLASLLQLSVDETEKSVSELVNNGMISAKINRPQGVIKFEKVKEGILSSLLTSGRMNEILTNWCYDVEKLLSEVDSIGHLINKEEMMHGIKQRA